MTRKRVKKIVGKNKMLGKRPAKKSIEKVDIGLQSEPIVCSPALSCISLEIDEQQKNFEPHSPHEAPFVTPDEYEEDLEN